MLDVLCPLPAVYNGEKEDDRTEPDDDEQKDAVIYLVEGRQICYGDKTAWDVARDC